MIFQIFFARLLGRKEREARGRLLSQDFIFGVYRAEYGLYNRRVLSCPSFFLYCVYIFSRFIYGTTQTLPGLFTRRKPPSRKSQGPCDAVARILHLFNFASIDAAASDSLVCLYIARNIIIGKDVVGGVVIPPFGIIM